jgi:tRNA(fMet)-specific endonuclease VapC
MTVYILDTDTLSRLHAGDPRVQGHKDRYDLSNVVTTLITRIEILRGRFDFVLKATNAGELRRAQEWLRRSEALLAFIAVIPIDDAAAEEFDKLRRNRSLKKIGRADLLIAAIALARGDTLVTRNVKHFRQVPGLKLENWTD